jgi:hypothetical protein
MPHASLSIGLVLAFVVVAEDVDAQRVRQQTPPSPFVDRTCPGEYCSYGKWVAERDAVVRVSRQPRARQAFRVEKGETVTALTGVVVTTRPTRIQFDRATDISTDNGRIRILPGQTLYMLTYEGEGFAKVWFNGRLYKGADTAEFYDNGVCEHDQSRVLGQDRRKG